MGPGSEFGVIMKREEVVAAALPLQEHWLPLSNLDLLLPPLDFSVFFCYQRPSSSFGCMVDALKKALAQALVPFYALAGEVVPNSLGEPEILCNNRGVDFLEAYANIDLEDLLLYNPDATVEGKLVSKKKSGVLCVQATELRCGGIVVAITLDHRVADACSANMFIAAWAEMAQGKQKLARYPSFRRSLLNPRRPQPYSSTDRDQLDEMYVPMSMAPRPPAADDDAAISRIYCIEEEQIKRMQRESSSRSKLVAFSAFLWQSVAKGAGEEAERCKMGIVVDGRRRMGMGMGDMITNYFGNVLSIPYAELSIAQLKAEPLSWVAERVSGFLEPATSPEHFLGLIDWVEVHRPKPFLTGAYCTRSNAEVALVVSSGLRFLQDSNADFGWGKPGFGSYHFPWGGRAGYVMPMPSPRGNGDWVVYIHLLKRHVDWLEAQASHVFRPIDSQHLSILNF